MSLVLDASAALAWAFERADPHEAELARARLARLAEEEAFVPELWHLEVVNALLVARRRGVIDAAHAHDFLERLAALPIRTHPASLAGRRESLFELAVDHGLSAYDAAYLDLALRTGAPLGTFDRRLAAAAQTVGVAAA